MFPKVETGMNVFLLVWNPKRWDHWGDHLGEVAKTAAGQPVPGSWSMSSRRSGVFPGDRLLLLRQGRESGILASGVAVGDGPECIYEDGHWDKSKQDETAFYTNLEWDTVLLPEDVLPRETLKQQVPEVTWERVQGSGQILESPVAKKLLALWHEHLSDIDDPESETWRSPTDDEGWFIEGKRTTKTVNRYERNRKARAECIARHGDSCVVCGFNFGKRYGEHGLGFIEVHHLKPVGGGGGKQRKVNPDRDLRPVCPNCHAMLHKTKDRSKPLSVAQLRRMLLEDLDEEDWEEEVEAQPPGKCPACGGNRFGTYLRGLIAAPDDELLRQMDQDEVRIMGCLVSDEDACWFCRDCDADILEEGWLVPDGEVVHQLNRLTELHYDGVIDYDEFRAARKRLLDPSALS